MTSRCGMCLQFSNESLISPTSIHSNSSRILNPLLHPTPSVLASSIRNIVPVILLRFVCYQLRRTLEIYQKFNFKLNNFHSENYFSRCLHLKSNLQPAIGRAPIFPNLIFENINPITNFTQNVLQI